MKIIFPAIISLICLFAACNKTTHNPGNGNGGNGGGGGGSDTLSVTGFSPLRPYTSDEVTITGTGFNPDKTKDSVFYVSGNGSEKGYLTISSATSTQLKIVFPPDSMTEIYYGWSMDISVIANGKRKNIKNAINFKTTCQVGSCTDPDVEDIGICRPGDSMKIWGAGFTLGGATFSVAGQLLNNVKVDSGHINCIGYTRLPKLIFGETNNEDTTEYKTVSVTNGDGKTSQRQFQFFMSPIMSVNNLYFEQNVYSMQALNSSGGKIRLHVIGKNLKNDVDVKLAAADGTDMHSALNVSGFPDSTIVEFGTAGLKPGVLYGVALWASNRLHTASLYGAANFTTTP